MAMPGWTRLALRLAVDTLVTSAGSVANDCTAPAACLAMTWLMVAMADPGGRVPEKTLIGHLVATRYNMGGTSGC